uniref:Equilibrative nucleoside transporter 1 n=1 Tax=Arcella intermedia TaxID=1963864 RepID=A0A6B2L5F1_9EUKA
MLSENTESMDNVPDKYYFVYFSILWLGFGFLTPYQMFISSIDYFTVLFPTIQVQYYIAWTYCVANAISFFPVLRFGPRYTFYTRIFVSFIIFTLILISISLLIAFNSLEFWFLMILTPLVGFTDALIQPALASYSAIFPGRYMVAYQTGNGVSGIVASLIRVLTKLLIPHDIKSSSLVYFIVGLLISISCVLVNMAADSTHFVQTHLKKLNTSFVIKEEVIDPVEGTTPKSETDQVQLNQDSQSVAESNIDWRRTKEYDFVGTVKSIPGPIISVFFTYVVTLSLFPGLVSMIPSDDFLSQESWFPIFLIALYNIFDFVGKMAPTVPLLDKIPITAVYIMTILRIFFYPVMLFCVKPRLIVTPIVPILATSLLALSNGLITSLLFVYVSRTAPLQNKEDCVSSMTLFLVIGLAVGSLVGLGFSFM